MVISGPGPIGLLSLLLVKESGCRAVVCGISKDEDRLALATRLGADAVINLEKENPQERIKEMTKGVGADVILECSGAAPAANLGLDLVKKRGKYTQIGLFGKPIEVDFEKIAYKEIEVRGSLSQRWTAWEKAIDLLSQGKAKHPVSDGSGKRSRFRNAANLCLGTGLQEIGGRERDKNHSNPRGAVKKFRVGGRARISPKFYKCGIPDGKGNKALQ